MVQRESTVRLPQRRRRRRSAPRRLQRLNSTVDTIIEEEEEEEEEETREDPIEHEEEEKTEFEPPDFDAVGSHIIFRRRTSGEGLSSSEESVDDDNSGGHPSLLDDDTDEMSNLHMTLNPSSTPLSRRLFSTMDENTQEQNIEEEKEDHHDTTSTPCYIGWIQLRSLLYKNYLVELPTLLFDILAPVGMVLFVLVLLHAVVSNVPNGSRPDSRPSWDIRLPLNATDHQFWTHVVTGQNTLDMETVRLVGREWFGPETAGFLLGYPTGTTTRSAAQQQQPLDAADWDSMRVTASKLLHRPFPIPPLGHYIEIALRVAPQIMGTLHVAAGSDNFIAYLKEAGRSQFAVGKRRTGKVTLRLHDTADAALTYIMNTTQHETVWALLDMTNYDDENDPGYMIRMNHFFLPTTTHMYGSTTSTSYQLYYMSGFLSLQHTINNYAFLVADAGAETSCYRKALRELVVSVPMPVAADAIPENPFLRANGFLVGFTCLVALLIPLSRLVKGMVDEKETQQWHLLQLAGVRLWAHWWSWYISGVALLSFVSFLIASILSLQIFTRTPFWVVLVWMLLFCYAVVSFSGLVTAGMSQTRLAVIVVPLLIMITALPRYLLFGLRGGGDGSSRRKLVACLFPGTAFVFAADAIVQYEDSLMEQNSLWEGEFSLLSAFVMLLVDAVLYAIVGSFLTLVLQYRAQVVGHLVDKVMGFCGTWTRNNDDLEQIFSMGNGDDETTDEEAPSTRSAPQDDASTSTTRCVVYSITLTELTIKHLHNRMEQLNHQCFSTRRRRPVAELQNISKRYGRSKSVPPAVSRVNFSLYPGQLTAILGHNGAGKSTLLRIITGALRPSTGVCMVDGVPLLQSDPRDFPIGLCPQEDVLFETVTVVHHLHFYISIKTGIVPSQDDVRSLAIRVGLGELLHIKAKALSPGNKRKLSLAIASCGRQRLVILDEPTSTMDLVSSRKCWKYLRRESRNKAIVVVTHNTEDAEEYADRVALMRHGAFQASGSCSFLEQRFQLGYKVTIVGTVRGETGFDFTGDYYLRMLRIYSRKVRMVRSIGQRVFVFQIPTREELAIPDLLKALDAAQECRRLETFGIESFSLMEVFHSLAEDSDDLSTDSPTDCSLLDSQMEDGSTLFSTGSTEKRKKSLQWISQISLMLWKRWVVQKRDLGSLLVALFVVVVLVALSITILTIKQPDSGPPLDMTITEGRVFGDSSLRVVGGAAFLNKYTQESDMKDLVERYRAALHRLDPIFEVEHGDQLSSSEELFSSLRRAMANGTAATGVLVLKDVMEVNWEVDEFWLSTSASHIAEKLVTERSEFSIDIPIGGAMGTLFPDIALDSETISRVMGSIVSAMASSFIEANPQGRGQYSVNTAATIVHNSSAPHSVAVYNNAFQEMAFASCGSRTLPRLTNHPLPGLYGQESVEQEILLKMTALLFVLIPLCSIPGIFLPRHVREFSSKAKFLQLSNGASLTAFWISNFIWDMFIHGIVSGGVFCVFVAYGQTTAVFVGDRDSALCTFLLLLGYGACALPFSYVLSMGCRDPGRAQIIVVGSIFMSGFVSVMAVFVLSRNETTGSIAEMITGPLRIFPGYNLADGFIKMSENYIFGSVRGVFERDVAGAALFAMATSTPAYLFLLFVVDCSSMPSLLSRLSEKFSVLYTIQDQNEAHFSHDKRFRSQNKTTLSVWARSLWKVYSPPMTWHSRLVSGAFQFLRCFCYALAARDPPERGNGTNRHRQAVKNLSFELEQGSILAVVGPNGCGKSSLLGLLSGEILPTSGSVKIDGKNLYSMFPWEALAARKSVGLCPQIDPVIELMTGREMLTMHCKLAGMREARISLEVEKLLKELELLPFSDNIIETYSCGNRRKLSLGMAIASDPSVLVIDESTSNLDPSSTQKIWQLISRAAAGRTVVMSTHRMEEAYLSSRTAIMSDGELVCFGAVTELQKQFFNFYTVVIHLARDTSRGEAMRVVRHVVKNSVPGSTLLEYFDCCLRLKWKHETGSAGVGRAFGRLRDLKTTAFSGRTLVKSFSMRHSDLDQVFLNVSMKAINKRSSHTRQHVNADEVATSATADSSHLSERLSV